MNLILTHQEKRPDGIFSLLTDVKGNIIAVTLEHAFLLEDGTYTSKLAKGTYTCKKGTGPIEGGLHALHDGIPFEAFEVQNVPPFLDHKVTGILFHIGNYNRDSDGCILLGKQFGWMTDGKNVTGKMICDSTNAFKAFMKLQQDDFELTVC